MNIDEARAYLKANFKPEYHKYIDKKLAGDFAVSIAEKMSEICNELERLHTEVDVQSYWGPKWEAEHKEVLRLKKLLKEANEEKHAN